METPTRLVTVVLDMTGEKPTLPPPEAKRFGMRRWRNGRRASLRCWWGNSRGGSSPLLRTADL